MNSTQAYYLYRINTFALSLAHSKYLWVQAIGGALISWLTMYCYAVVMQAGEKEFQRRSQKKKNGRHKKMSGL